MAISVPGLGGLDAHADVKAADLDPLLHDLDQGRHEGRSMFAGSV